MSVSRGSCTHVRPADHIDGREMHSHEGRMFDDLVWEVDAEGITGKTEAEAEGTILAAESDVGVEVEHCALHAQVSLVGHGFDVVLAMLHEATVGQGTTVPQKPSREPDDSTMTVLA